MPKLMCDREAPPSAARFLVDEYTAGRTVFEHQEATLKSLRLQLADFHNVERLGQLFDGYGVGQARFGLQNLGDQTLGRSGAVEIEPSHLHVNYLCSSTARSSS